MSDFVVRGERVVLPDAVRPAAIHIRDGCILSIAAYDDVPAGVTMRDVGELMVLPGFVDPHVHMNDPGRADWEGVEHATAAAAAGGVTTVIDMPLNCVPSTTTAAALEVKRSALAGRAAVDVGFWGGVVPGNAHELGPLARAGALGFKCFLAPSGVDEFEHVTEADLRAAMPALATLGLPLLAHAELPAELRSPGASRPRDYATWLASRPPAAEQRAIELLVSLAVEYGTRVHIVHVASAEALGATSAARRRGVPLTAETCPHYLTFAAEEIPDGATAFKCAPPIRERAQRERLWQALADGEIDLVASDHSPAPAYLKCVDTGDFVAAWGGIASVQVAASAVATGAAARGIPIERVVQWMSAAPARLAGLTGRKGAIVAGADADLVFWDAGAEFVVNPSTFRHRHGATPYAGLRLRGRAAATMLRGTIVFEDDRLLSANSGRMITSPS